MTAIYFSRVIFLQETYLAYVIVIYNRRPLKRLTMDVLETLSQVECDSKLAWFKNSKVNLIQVQINMYLLQESSRRLPSLKHLNYSTYNSKWNSSNVRVKTSGTLTHVYTYVHQHHFLSQAFLMDDWESFYKKLCQPRHIFLLCSTFRVTDSSKSVRWLLRECLSINLWERRNFRLPIKEWQDFRCLFGYWLR